LIASPGASSISAARRSRRSSASARSSASEAPRALADQRLGQCLRPGGARRQRFVARGPRRRGVIGGEEDEEGEKEEFDEKSNRQVIFLHCAPGEIGLVGTASSRFR